MHPASSVIFFTTATGAGYGFMAAFALHALFGGPPPDGGAAFLMFAVAFALIVGGLTASTFHLGHPGRAWRALTQWRSSWLSREGVLAIFFFIPGGLTALLAIFRPSALDGAAGAPLLILTAVSAMAVVLATGMIYAQLRAVPAWHDPLTPVGYLAMSAASGTTLLCAAKALAGLPPGFEAVAALFATAVAGLVKALAWTKLDRPLSASTASTATGLAGDVRMLDAPHTQANYLLKEMGFQLARAHAARLRWAAILLGFVAPPLLLWVGQAGAFALAPLAFLSMIAGFACERWLFFAEAKHVVTLYYGARRI